MRASHETRLERWTRQIGHVSQLLGAVATLLENLTLVVIRLRGLLYATVLLLVAIVAATTLLG